MRNAILLILISLALLCGCEKSVRNGRSPLPELDERDELKFKEEEKPVIAEFAAKYPDIFFRIQGEVKALRAIIRTYNQRAREHNRELLKEAGFKEEEIKKMIKDSPVAPAVSSKGEQ